MGMLESLFYRMFYVQNTHQDFGVNGQQRVLQSDKLPLGKLELIIFQTKLFPYIAIIMVFKYYLKVITTGNSIYDALTGWCSCCFFKMQ